MSYKTIIYMTFECSICFEPFIMPAGIINSISKFENEVLEKTIKFIESNRISKKIDICYIIHRFLKKYYNRLWYPNFKQYKCSTEKCSATICGNCVLRIEKKSDNIVFQCTHCRLFDWKTYMTKYVFPEMIMIYLSRSTGNHLFTMREFAKIGFM